MTKFITVHEQDYHIETYKITNWTPLRSRKVYEDSYREIYVNVDYIIYFSDEYIRTTNEELTHLKESKEEIMQKILDMN